MIVIISGYQGIYVYIQGDYGERKKLNSKKTIKLNYKLACKQDVWRLTCKEDWLVHNGLG